MDCDETIIECDLSELTDGELDGLLTMPELREIAEQEQTRRLVTPDVPATRYFRLPTSNLLNGEVCANMLSTSAALFRFKGWSPAGQRLADRVHFVAVGAACALLRTIKEA